MKKATDGRVSILRAAALVLGGAAAWIVLSSAQAGAIALVDQESTTVNAGAGISNTGVNGAVGNTSTNNADVDQTATADGGFAGDAVAVNTASANTNSGGTASIATGNANSVGNQSSTSNAQVADTNDGGFALVDQETTTINAGLGVSNTGFNFAVGNGSNNTTDIDQTADADGGFFGDAIAVNTANSSNNSTGNASILTGNANSIGNASNTTNVQAIDTGDAFFTLADQSNTTFNLGFGLANSGFNFAAANVSTNNADPITQNATADPGFFGDAVAVNTANSSNNSTGNALIATGSANAIGNTSTDHNSQVLNTVATRPAGSNPAIPLALLLAFLFVGTPVRRLATRRR